MTSFMDADREAYLTSLSARDIINSLTLKDVYNFLVSLGVEQIEINEEKQYLICPTICHNPIHEAESMKLYWYHNNKIFKCYTECDAAMSIFELYQKYMAINYYPISLDEAKGYVEQYLTHIIVPITNAASYESFNSDKYQFDINIPILKEYNPSVLDCFVKYYHPTWLRDGITPAAMDKFNIRFALAQNKIIIPHLDRYGRLVGIRARTLDPIEAEQYGKYRPIQIGDILYTHPLQFNLYGIFEHQAAIKKLRTAIMVEGEKSVLLDHVYYGDYGCSVACCGFNFNKYHISLLADILGVNEIIVAFDKEYNSWKDDIGKKYIQKIETLCKHYMHKVNFSYILDYDNVLNEKDSPFDRGQEIFEHLFKTRVKVR